MKDGIVMATSLEERGKRHLPSLALFLLALHCAFVTADKILAGCFIEC